MMAGSDELRSAPAGPAREDYTVSSGTFIIELLHTIHAIDARRATRLGAAQSRTR